MAPTKQSKTPVAHAKPAPPVSKTRRLFPGRDRSVISGPSLRRISRCTGDPSTVRKTVFAVCNRALNEALHDLLRDLMLRSALLDRAQVRAEDVAAETALRGMAVLPCYAPPAVKKPKAQV